MSEAERLLIVSDLHLAAGPRDPFTQDAAFAAWAASRLRGDQPARLIILGDLFDFVLTPRPGQRPTIRPDGSEAGALARLESIAAAHPDVIDVLAGFVDAGGRLDLVPGNHDIELTRAAVQTRLHALLGHPPPERVRVHPWILHLPGVLYAEHGHQHHDLNAFATLLAPYRHGDELDLPLGTHLAHLQMLASPAGRVRAALGLGSVCTRGLLPRERAHLRAYRRLGLAEEAGRVGLDRGTLAAIDAVTPRGASATAIRLARTRLRAGADPAAMLHRAAEHIHRRLAAHGQEVPFYVFGHSHVLERRSMAAGAATPLYLNAGTWSQLPRRIGPPPCGYIEVTLGAGPPRAELMRWDGERPQRAAFRAGGRSPRQPAAGRSETAHSPR
jgi:UDP-2,3-diacylglucosamine pyrophosphatase LpxH